MFKKTHILAETPLALENQLTAGVTICIPEDFVSL